MDVLRQFPEDPLPPSGVDVAHAVHLGRRRRRARTGFATIALVAIVAAGVVAVPQFLRRGPMDPMRPATEPLTCATPGPLPALTPPPNHGGAPTEFDVLRHWVGIDAVTGFRVEHYDTARFWQRLELTNATQDRKIEVTVYPRDGQPVFATEPGTAPAPIDPTTGSPTDPVGGNAAFWLPGRQRLYQFEVARLGWLWAPGAWAFVAAADTSNYDGTYNDKPKTADQIASLRTLARQAATALRIGASTPVVSPFTMLVPDCTRVVGTALLLSTRASGEPFGRLSLTFAPKEYEASGNPLLHRGGVRTVQVTAHSGTSPDDKPGSATSEVDGHRAYYDGDFMVIYGVDGFSLELSAPGGSEAVISLFRTVHIVPGATYDPATWTDSPLEP